MTTLIPEKPPEPIMVDIQTGVLSSLLYFLLTINRLIQEWISNIFWFLFVKPALWLAQKIGKTTPPKENQSEAEKKPFVALDCLKPGQNILWHYLSWGFKIPRLVRPHHMIRRPEWTRTHA